MKQEQHTNDPAQASKCQITSNSGRQICAYNCSMTPDKTKQVHGDNIDTAAQCQGWVNFYAHYK